MLKKCTSCGLEKDHNKDQRYCEACRKVKYPSAAYKANRQAYQAANASQYLQYYCNSALSLVLNDMCVYGFTYGSRYNKKDHISSSQDFSYGKLVKLVLSKLIDPTVDPTVAKLNGVRSHAKLYILSGEDFDDFQDRVIEYLESQGITINPDWLK